MAQPDNGEQCLEIADTLVRSGGLDAIIIDSAAALVPRAEIEGDMGAPHVGLLAGLLSQGMRKMVGAAKRNNCAVIFINQLREKVGDVWGNHEVTPGGRALKFYSSVRIDIRRLKEKVRDGDKTIGTKTKVKVVKNKVAPPFKEAEFNIMYGTGVDRIGELIDIAVKNEIISKSGAWHSYGDERLGQGQENAKNYLNENPEILKEIEAKVMSLIEIKNAVSEENSTEEEQVDQDMEIDVNQDIIMNISQKPTE